LQAPIRYVIYVIKENRTYDQVLGDMREGNGAPELVLFGEPVTPNHHALARQFVLFDNFYVDGDVSADGHVWSTAASSTDYVNKLWPSFYARRLNYDFVGPDYDGDEQHDHDRYADEQLFHGRLQPRLRFNGILDDGRRAR